jgi:DNA-binding transcriptional LysR family regulator
MMDWNDLRYFIAVADAGSTLAAGRKLRVSQTTVARRIAALEQALSLSLFERRQAGYVLTAAGEDLLGLARRVESAATSVADTASGLSREASGIVRLTTIEIYAVTVLPAVLRDLHEAHPDIRIELDTSEQQLDLASGAADIALRVSATMTGAGVVGRRIAFDPWALYCSRGYAEAHGVPRNRAELASHTLIGGGGARVWGRYRAWLVQNGLEPGVAMHHDSATGLLAAVRSGFGLAVLPTFVADREPDLVRCLPPHRKDQMAVWLLTHERLRHVLRVRVVLDFLAERLSRLAQEEPAGEAA